MSLRCDTCGRESPEDAAFCSGCGCSLPGSCPSCGRGNPADAAFCSGCGQRLAAPRAPTSPALLSPRDYTPRHLAETILRTGAHAWFPLVHEARAELERACGDAAAAERELREAQRLYTAMGATGHAERLARELAP